MALLLLIDPQPLTRELLAQALMAQGHEVGCFAGEPTPQEARWEYVDALLVSASAIRSCDRTLYARYRKARVSAGRAPWVVALIDQPIVPAMQAAFATVGIDRLVGTQDFCWDTLIQMLAEGLVTEVVKPPVLPAVAQPVVPTLPAAPDPAGCSGSTLGGALASPAMGSGSTPGVSVRSSLPTYVPELDEQELLKSLSPAVSRETIDALAGRLDTLCPNDVMTQRVRTLVSAEAEVDPMAQAIGRDPVLTLRVLAWANALPNPSGHAPAESLRTAVDRLGRAGLAQRLEAMQTQPADASGGIDWLGFTLHAKAVAHLSAELARLRQCNAEEVQAAFTAGMLHDLGRLLYARLLPQENREVLEAAEALSLPVERVEQQMLLDDHAQLLDKALRKLNMGRRVINAVACHHLPLSIARNLTGKNLTDVLQLALADRLANAMLFGEPDTGALQGAEHHIHVLRLPTDLLRRGLQQVGEVMSAKRDAMIKDLGLASHEALTVTRFRALPVSARPVFVGSDPHADPVAVFCRSLWTGASETPNLAVVRMTNVRERETLTGKLKALEFEKGTGKLPVLMLSPRGNLTLDDSALPGRHVELHAEPMPYPRLLTMLPRLLDENRQKAAA